jgi:hypothetical protein
MKKSGVERSKTRKDFGSRFKTKRGSGGKLR